MTQQEWLKRQRLVLADIVKNNNPLRIAARTAHKDITLRVFIEGIKESGAPIGTYDTKRPMYINPDTAARATGGKTIAPGFKLQGLKPTKGKHGDHKFKNGNVHKTTFVNNYKDFRNRIGRRTDRVNLVLTGELQSDFANGKITNPIPTKITQHEYHVGLSRAQNMDKVHGLEKKYGKIFKHTKAEIDKFVQIASKELRNEYSKRGL